MGDGLAWQGEQLGSRSHPEGCTGGVPSPGLPPVAGVLGWLPPTFLPAYSPACLPHTLLRA